jgi:hypothetical protein
VSCDAARVSRIETEEYKRLPRSQYMENRCRKIWNRFLRTGAPMAITVTDEARRQAKERMEDPGPLTFQMAETEVSSSGCGRDCTGRWLGTIVMCDGLCDALPTCAHGIFLMQVFLFMESCLLPKFRKSAEYLELMQAIEMERKNAAQNPVK